MDGMELFLFQSLLHPRQCLEPDSALTGSSHPAAHSDRHILILDKIVSRSQPESSCLQTNIARKSF